MKNLPESFGVEEVTEAFKEFGELEGIKVARAGRPVLLEIDLGGCVTLIAKLTRATNAYARRRCAMCYKPCLDLASGSDAREDMDNSSWIARARSWGATGTGRARSTPSSRSRSRRTPRRRWR